jgi:hypothetical protein
MPKRRQISGDYAEVAAALDEAAVVRDFAHALMTALDIPSDDWWCTPAQETVTFALAAVLVAELAAAGVDRALAIHRVCDRLGILPQTFARMARRWRQART